MSTLRRTASAGTGLKLPRLFDKNPVMAPGNLDRFPASLQSHLNSTIGRAVLWEQLASAECALLCTPCRVMTMSALPVYHQV